MRGWLSILSVALILAANSASAHRAAGVSGGFAFRAGGAFMHHRGVPGPLSLPSRLAPDLRFSRTVPSLSPTVPPLIPPPAPATVPAPHVARITGVRVVEFGVGPAVRTTSRSGFRIVEFGDQVSFTGTGRGPKIVVFGDQRD